MEVIDPPARIAAPCTISRSKSAAATLTGICPLTIVGIVVAGDASERFEGPDGTGGHP